MFVVGCRMATLVAGASQDEPEAGWRMVWHGGGDWRLVVVVLWGSVHSARGGPTEKWSLDRQLDRLQTVDFWTLVHTGPIGPIKNTV